MLAHLGPNLQLPYIPAHEGRQYHGTLSLCSVVRDLGSARAPVTEEGRATNLREVLAHVLGRRSNVVTEGTSVPRLASALPEEFTRNVGGV